MNRSRCWLVAAISCALLLPACTHRDPPPQQTVTIEVSYDDLLSQKTITRQADLRVGDALTISLGANPSTGYQWETEAQISDRAVLSPAGHRTVAPGSSRPGAPGADEWTFEAMAPGTATVTTSYGQPWPGGQKNAWTFTAKVTVS